MHLNACAVTCTETIRSKTSEYNRFRFAFGDHFRLVLFPPSSLTLFPNRTVFPWYSPLFARPHTTSRFWSFAPSCFDACFDDIICVCLCVCVCVCLLFFSLSLSLFTLFFVFAFEETKSRRRRQKADFSLFFCSLAGSSLPSPPPAQEDKIISSRSSLPECRPSVPPPVVRKMARACTQRERERERKDRTGKEAFGGLRGVTELARRFEKI